MSVRLFVGNLLYDATEASLRELFSEVGPLSYVFIPTDRETGKPRGFAFVEFSDPAQAEEAIRRFNNQPFKGRPLAINEARAKDSSAPQRSFAPQRPSASQRPFEPRLPSDMIEQPARPGETNRNFGPDAAPRRVRSKTNRGAKSERGPKGPIRERLGGQFFGETDDNSSDDDLSGENFASRVDDPEDNN